MCIRDSPHTDLVTFHCIRGDGLSPLFSEVQLIGSLLCVIYRRGSYRMTDWAYIVYCIPGSVFVIVSKPNWFNDVGPPFPLTGYSGLLGLRKSEAFLLNRHIRTLSTTLRLCSQRVSYGSHMMWYLQVCNLRVLLSSGTARFLANIGHCCPCLTLLTTE